MEFPKKISRNNPKDETPPDILIRGSGEPGNIKIVEYVILKLLGSIVMYKRK